VKVRTFHVQPWLCQSMTLMRKKHLSAKKRPPPHPPQECSTTANTSGANEGSHSNTWYAPVPDGLLAERQRRRYSMHNLPRRTREIGQRRETLKEKVKLDSVVAAKMKGMQA
jgi:hypothetical protein